MTDDPNGPKNLDKLFDQIKGMARLCKRNKPTRGSRPVVYAKSPRQVCDICLKLYDYAICNTQTEPTLSRCEDCKQKLSEGYIAVTCLKGGYAFIKSESLSEFAGKMLRVSDETFQAVQAKSQSNNREQDIPKQPDSQATDIA